VSGVICCDSATLAAAFINAVYAAGKEIAGHARPQPRSTPLAFPTYFQPTLLRVLATTLTLNLVACATPAGRQAADNSSVQAEAAREVHRICALPEGERQAQIERVRKQSGVVIGCGKAP